MARPIVGIIGNAHLINNEYPAHAGGTMNSQAIAEVSGAMPLLIPADPRLVAVEELLEACKALRRENHEVLYASMIKDTMKRKKPSFDESYYGYRSFTHLLEDMDDAALVDIERNPKSGTYVVTRVVDEGEAAKPGAAPPKPRPALPAPASAPGSGQGHGHGRGHSQRGH